MHLTIIMAAIAIGLDFILIDIVGLIAISLDCISIGVDGGFDGGFDGGLFNQFHLAVLGYQPQQSVQQFRQEAFTAIAKRVLQAITIGTNPLIEDRVLW